MIPIIVSLLSINAFVKKDFMKRIQKIVWPAMDHARNVLAKLLMLVQSAMKPTKIEFYHLIIVFVSLDFMKTKISFVSHAIQNVKHALVNLKISAYHAIQTLTGP
jgi:hypothetical protein